MDSISKKNTLQDTAEPLNGSLIPPNSNNRLASSTNNTTDVEKSRGIGQDENKMYPMTLRSDSPMSGSHVSVMSLVFFASSMVL